MVGADRNAANLQHGLSSLLADQLDAFFADNIICQRRESRVLSNADLCSIRQTAKIVFGNKLLRRFVPVPFLIQCVLERIDDEMLRRLVVGLGVFRFGRNRGQNLPHKCANAVASI